MFEETMSPAENTPSEEELRTAADIISRLPRNGLWPPELFYEVAGRVVMPIVEVVPVRDSDHSTQILLLRRPADDPNWPGKLHTPGTVLRPTDLDADGLGSAFERIANDELGVPFPATPQSVGFDFHRVNRGPEMANVFVVDMGGIDITNGEWHDANNLPDDIVDTQKGFISDAVQAFERSKA